MDEGHLVGEALNDLNTPPFIVDSKPSHGRPYYELHFYERCGDGALGMEQTEEDGNARRCFNCGEPGHEVSSCSQHRDHALISLSRQMHNFFKEESFASSQRLHEVEGWRRQRLAWLEEFEPGQVRGGLLRDALGLRDGDVGEYVEWLRNMAIWGYPKGWIGDIDPRLQVWKILTGEDRQDDLDNSDETFIITGEYREELRLPSEVHAAPTLRDNDNTSAPDSESSGTPPEQTVDERRSHPLRWATYPDTYFLSSKLFVYNGEGVPGPAYQTPSSAVSSSFNAERQALWDRIVSGSHASAPMPPLPSDLLPPPPPLSPPPLPPASPPPPHPSNTPPLTLTGVLPSAKHSKLNNDSDMDLSDAD